MRLTALSKFLVTIVVLGAVGLALFRYKDRLQALLAPAAEKPAGGGGSVIPPKVTLPDDPQTVVTAGAAGCADKPVVRFYHWAWNAQMGMILATGGKQAA